MDVANSRGGAVALGRGSRGARRNRGIEQRYARLYPSGAVMRCRPGRAELEHRCRVGGGSGNDGKVIYPDRAAAQAAAAALQVVDGQARRAYPCPRSRHGHFHLADVVPRRVRASIQAWQARSPA